MSLSPISAAKMMLMSVVQTDCKAILLLINGVCNHSGVYFSKNCLLLAVLWKNNAYWGVSASDCLLTVT